MNRIGVKMAAAFALVAILSVAAVGIAARVAVRSEFRGYLYHVRMRRGMPQGDAAPGMPGPPRWAPGDLLPPDPQAVQDHLSMMRRMMGPRADLMGRMMAGLPERRFLQRVDRLLWQVAGVAALGGAVAGALMARRWSGRLNRLAHKALERARRAAPQGEPPEPTGDEIEQLDAAFAAMEQALEMEDRRRRRLLADIAHELKTPLAVVQANLEAMLDGVLPASPERLAALHTQVSLLSRLVTDLRELAMAEAGELALRRELHDVGQLVRQVVDLWGPQAQERGVQVELEVDGEPKALVDPDRFAQVLLNLLSNALRYVPSPGGHILIRVYREPAPGQLGSARGHGPAREGASRDGPSARGSVVVTVEDNGPGIRPEDLPYIFDHFYRGDPARARATGGFGVGLGIVRSLVEAHGGRVRAENRPEGGARFELRLPEASADATGKADRPAAGGVPA